MNSNNDALMRSWAGIALRNEGHDPRRDAVARFILDNVDDPYEKIEAGSAWIVKFEGEERVAVRGKTRWYMCETDEHFPTDCEAVELVSELVPKSTPEHPMELSAQMDYRNAPVGTVVSDDGDDAWTKRHGEIWETFGILSGYNNSMMAEADPRRVLRWGWRA